MRTLTAGLLAAQRAASGLADPFIEVGGVSYTPRLKGIYHVEKPYGGMATILLDNSDKGIVADLRGKLVEIDYGFWGEVGSQAPRLWVLTQTNISREGQLLTQLQCLDTWQKLSLLKISAGGGVELKGTIEGVFSIGREVEGGTSNATGWVIATGDGFIGVGKVVGGPFSVGEVVSDKLQSTIKITSVTSVTDFGGGSPVAWDDTKTIEQIISELSTGVATVIVDDSDGIVDVTKPSYETSFGVDYRTIIQAMMNYTKCAIRVEEDDKLHIFDISSPPGTPDYEYDTAHCFFTDLRDVSLMLPNRVVVVSREETLTGITPYAGEASDAAAIAMFMEVVEAVLANVSSDAAATALAESMLNRVEKESTRGTIEVPMNCGQELFDYIKIVDTRADITYYGWIGSMERRWEEGVYKLTIGLGGLSGAVGLPDDSVYPTPVIDEIIVPSAIITPGPLPVSAGGYIADVKINSVDQDHISWDAGNIRFGDGRTQATDASVGNQLLTGVHYLYATWGSSTLILTTDAAVATGPDKVLVGVVSKGSVGVNNAYVLNPFTDNIIINTDKVMDNLVTELKLASEAVTEAKIKASAVTEGKIAALAVTAGKIDALAVNADKIAANAVTADKINAGAITAVKLAASIVLVSTLYAGDVTIDSTGIEVDGDAIKFIDEAYIGYVYMTSGLPGMMLLTLSGKIRLSPDSSLVECAGHFKPLTTQIFDLGSSSLEWEHVYSEQFIGTILLKTGYGGTLTDGMVVMVGDDTGDIKVYSNAAWRTNAS